LFKTFSGLVNMYNENNLCTLNLIQTLQTLFFSVIFLINVPKFVFVTSPIRQKMVNKRPQYKRIKRRFNILPAILVLTKLLLCSETPCLCQIYRLSDLFKNHRVSRGRPERFSSSSNIRDKYSGCRRPNFDRYYAYSFFSWFVFVPPNNFLCTSSD
jgi:hypothetical protein